MMWPPLVRRWWHDLAELVLPVECPLCGGAPEVGVSPFCRKCAAEVEGDTTERCPRCALGVGQFAYLVKGCASCRGQALGFDAAITLGSYEDPWRKLGLRLKRRPGSWVAGALGDAVLRARGAAIEAALAAGPGEPLVVAVPLHWRRHSERGYNQAEALAGRIAAAMGYRQVRALRRVKATPKLARMSVSERAAELKGAFRARRAARRVAGQTVLLVDDIMTTGSTCGAAARALKLAGAKRVVAVVVARAQRE